MSDGAVKSPPPSGTREETLVSFAPGKGRVIPERMPTPTAVPVPTSPPCDLSEEELDGPPPVTFEMLEEKVKYLESVLEGHPELVEDFYQKEAVEALKRTSLFHCAPEAILEEMGSQLERIVFPAGSMIVEEGGAMDTYIISEGRVQRWLTVGGRQHNATTFCFNSIGLLHLYNPDAYSRFNAECQTEVVAYRLTKDVLDDAIRRHPELSTYIIKELAWTVRNQSHQLETPFMEHKSHKISYTATALASSIESFYRSALNNLINQKVTGKLGAFFPNMHIQIPTRVVYITGLKQIRSSLDHIDLGDGPYATYYRIMLCTIPGLAMSPFSSILEATNAGMSNPESMTTRWMRGYSPRMLREVIFAAGINQVADFFAERIGRRITEHDALRGAIGSVTAGVAAGYLSHVPHVMSTLKLYSPNESYMVLWKQFYSNSMHLVPQFVPHQVKPLAAQIAAVFFPIGVVRRSVQICGTFTIINGVTYGLRDFKWY